jgi:hypothetical protein
MSDVSPGFSPLPAPLAAERLSPAIALPLIATTALLFWVIIGNIVAWGLLLTGFLVG